MNLLELKNKIDEIIKENSEYAELELWQDGGDRTYGACHYYFAVETAYQVEESDDLQPNYIMEDKTRFNARYYTIKNKILKVC